MVLTQVPLDKDSSAALTALLQRPLAATASVAVRCISSSRVKSKNKTGRASAKQMEGERDRRAMHLALANARAQAARLAEAEHSWVRGAADLQTLLGLPPQVQPARIECYDVSHSQGEQTVAARVVLLNGEPAQHLYRTYNIRTAAPGDDYAAIQEVISRRFRRVKGRAGGRGAGGGEGADEWPDVVVIDGGKGQLGAALAGLEAAGVATDFHARVTVCALAKKHEEVFLPGAAQPLATDANQPGMLLLRAARDESHRFALSRHRRARSRALFQ